LLQGPFGEVIRATGPMAKANPFRFSTKYQDDETDLLYFTFRYYNSSTGRWISRDQLNEQGFELLRRKPLLGSPDVNLYCYVRNEPVDRQDELGLEVIVANPGTGQQVCQVLTITAGTIEAALLAVPVGAIVVSAAVVGSVAVVGYTICHPRQVPRTWCPSKVNVIPITAAPPEPEQCPKEVDEVLPNGIRHCEFWCRKSGFKVNKYGSECDTSTIKYPETHPGTQPLPPYPPPAPSHP
jgi:RHS repeat-associated protein